MLLSALLLTPAAWTQGPPPPPPGGGPRVVPPYVHLAAELGLGEDQKTSLKAILDSHRSAMEAHADADRKAKEALLEAVRRGRGDLAPLHAASAAAELAFFQAAQKVNAACLAVLTPAQQEKLKTLRPPRPGEGGPKDPGMPPRGHERGGPEGGRGPERN